MTHEAHMTDDMSEHGGGSDDIIADDTGADAVLGDGMPRDDAEYGRRLEKGIARADKQYRLSTRDRLFLLYYLDRSNPETYLNPRSAMRMAAADKPIAYNVRAYQVLSRLRQIGAYDLVLNTIGAGVEVRLHLLARIASGVSETSETIYDADGVVKARKVKAPTFREQIAALQELNRMDGTYGKLKAAAKVQGEYARDEYTRLRERARKAIEDASSGRRIAPDRKQTGKDAPIDAEVVTEQERAEDAL